jgi:hypothetical protein
LLAADRLTNEGDGHQDFAGRNVVARVPPAIQQTELRRRPLSERSAA